MAMMKDKLIHMVSEMMLLGIGPLLPKLRVDPGGHWNWRLKYKLARGLMMMMLARIYWVSEQFIGRYGGEGGGALNYVGEQNQQMVERPPAFQDPSTIK